MNDILSKEEFQWPTTRDYFAGWLESYGMSHQPHFREKDFWGLPKDEVIFHLVTVGQGDIAGYIRFDFTVEETSFAQGAASLITQVSVIGQPTPGLENPHRAELESYFANLMARIRLQVEDWQ